MFLFLLKFPKNIRKLMIKNIKYILFFILLFFSFCGYTQTREELEKKHKKTQEEIKYTNNLLKQTRRDKKISMNQLVILNKKINVRQELINTISGEITNIDNKINENSDNINKLEGNLKQLKQNYAKMIVFAYKTRSSYDKLLFILSAKDFNNAYRRLKYLQQYADFRKKQMEAIVSTKQEITSKINDLQMKKNDKEVLLNEGKTETEKLTTEKKQQSDMLKTLKTKENDLTKKLAEQKLADKKLKNIISDLIAEEIKKAEIARKEKLKKEKENKLKTTANENKTNINNTSNKIPVKSNTESIFNLTPAEQIVSDKFETNKGKLPWPIERGVVTSTFGEHEHPILKGIKIKNDGIYISTTTGSAARSVFDGTISKIISIPGKNKTIIIRHGDFLSVYSNLKDVFVNVGDKVKTKQKLGTVFTDSDDENKTILELQIWHGTVKQNPEVWLSGTN